MGTPKTIEKYGISSSSIQKWMKIRKNPLPCDQCSEVFGYKHHLAQHIKSCHGANNSSANEEKFSDFVVMKNISDKLDKANPKTNWKFNDKQSENGMKGEDMENELSPSLHCFYPEVVKTEIADEAI